MRVAYDITQFASHPAASGIQRVLSQIASHCSLEDRFIVWRDGEALILTPGAAAELLDIPFCSKELPTSVLDRAGAWSLGAVAEPDIWSCVDQFVIAELSYSESLISTWQRLRADSPDRIAAIFYDSAPETRRELFRGRTPVGSGRYFRLITEIERVGCISDDSLRQLQGLARLTRDGWFAIPLGCDALPSTRRPDDRYLIVVGDLKEKKRVDLTIGAFQNLAGEIDLSLVIVGRPIGGSERIADLVRQAAKIDSRVAWYPEATDETLIELVAGATASVFIANDEGFGLPALESLWCGVPVIADSSLPALAYVEDRGQIRVVDVTVPELSDAMRRVAGEEGQRLRQDTEGLALPTWSAFVNGLRDRFTGGVQTS
jgi:glycosyltransferase involved in cell wall biosynthesis